MIKIYLTPSCPYCSTLKEFFKDHNIKFKEIDVSKNEKDRDEMIEKSGQMNVPIVEIDKKIIIGFDKEKICKLLGIKE